MPHWRALPREQAVLLLPLLTVLLLGSDKGSEGAFFSIKNLVGNQIIGTLKIDDRVLWAHSRRGQELAAPWAAGESPAGVAAWPAAPQPWSSDLPCRSFPAPFTVALCSPYIARATLSPTTRAPVGPCPSNKGTVQTSDKGEQAKDCTDREAHSFQDSLFNKLERSPIELSDKPLQMIIYGI